jgi:hypothetical protein
MISHTRNNPVCVICGTTKNVEQNHAGGLKHIAWFTVPFCERHHAQFHRQLEGVGINLRYTPNKLKRLVMAALALSIAIWIVLQALWEVVSALPDEDVSL